MYVVTWCQYLHIDAELRTCFNALESPSPCPPPPEGGQGEGVIFQTNILYVRLPVGKPDPFTRYMPV